MKHIFLLFTLMTAFGLHAADRESVANGDWSDKCTWDAGCSQSIPDKSDDVTIKHDVTLDISLTGSSQIKGTLTIASGGSLTDEAGGSAFDMRIQNNGELILEGDISIDGNFELQGSSVLTIKNGATLTVSGDVDWSGTTTVVVESGGELNVGGTLTIDQNSDDITINGTVNVTEDLSVATGVDVAGDGQFVVEGNVDNSGVLFDEEADENCTDCIIPSQSLPVDLVHFETIQSDNGQVLISWITALELNNSHFELQRSDDAIHWETIETIAGKGTYVGRSFYSSSDVNKVSHVTYYRLKQVDFDGAYQLSEIQVVHPGYSSALPEISVVNGQLLVTANHLQSEHIWIYVYNSSGKALYMHKARTAQHAIATRVDFNLPRQQPLLIHVMSDRGTLGTEKLFMP